MELVGLVITGLVAVQLLNWVKAVTNQKWNTVVTVPLVALAGIASVFLVAETVFADTELVFDQTLAALGFWDKVVVGILAGNGIGSTLFDLKKAFDNSDSAHEPPLLPFRDSVAHDDWMGMIDQGQDRTGHEGVIDEETFGGNG